MASSADTCGPDTVHLTFREGGGRSPEELSSLLAEFQRMYELPTAPVVRDRGVQGFAAAAVDKAAGLRLDWTRPGEEGQNPGYFCLQVQGTWFEQADGDTAADLLQLLQAYGPLRATRLDFAQTIHTKRHLTPWWIRKFEQGKFRVLGRKHYEPRGSRDALGGYPLGATLYHGSRNSERFARQYDKHLQKDSGEPRRRDEVEIKGQSCRDLWTDLQVALGEAEATGLSRGATLHSFSKRSIRAFLPIRDCSQWPRNELPANWSRMAKEPTTWANLFEEDALTIKPREKTVTGLLKSYRYATQNFSASIYVMFLLKSQELEQQGFSEEAAWGLAAEEHIDEMCLAANPDKIQEFASEFHLEKASRITAAFLAHRDAARRRVRAREEGMDGPIG